MNHLVRTALLLLLLFATAQLTHAQQPSQQALERERGIELYQSGRIDDAGDALRRAVKKNKTDWEAWYFLGLTLIRQKDLKEASKSFETSLRLQPQFAAGHAGLGYSLLLRNKFADAIREAETALKLDPTIPDAHYVVGVSRLRMGKRDAALAEAEAVIKMKPDFGPAYLLKSQALANFVVDTVAVDPDRFTALNHARFREAAEALEKYLQLTPNAEFKDTWTEQLKSLRFFSSLLDKDNPDRVMSGKEVTTKVRVLAKPEPTYTEEARRNGVTGTVILRCVFRADGKVAHFLVVAGLPDGLTEMSIRSARKITFVPATINGRPVSMWMELQYNFNLF